MRKNKICIKSITRTQQLQKIVGPHLSWKHFLSSVFWFSLFIFHPLLSLCKHHHTAIFLLLSKVAKVDETKHCNHVHLFTDKNFHDPTRSLNHQMAQSELFKQRPDVFLTSHRCAKHPPLQLDHVHLISEIFVCVFSFHSPAKIFTSKNSSTSTSSNGSPTATSAAAKPHLRRALSGPREATGGSTATIIPQEAPSSPTVALKLPPLLDLPSAGLKDLYKVHSNSIDE